MAWTTQITPFYWLIFGLLLLICEIAAPGAYFLWSGIAAIVVAILLLSFPSMTFLWQIILFSALSVVAVIAYKRYLKQHPSTSDEPALNRRAERYVNQTFTLAEPIVSGKGTLKVDDSTWEIHGADAPIGSQVRVTAATGQVLTVVVEK